MAALVLEEVFEEGIAQGTAKQKSAMLGELRDVPLNGWGKGLMQSSPEHILVERGDQERGL